MPWHAHPLFLSFPVNSQSCSSPYPSPLYLVNIQARHAVEIATPLKSSWILFHTKLILALSALVIIVMITKPGYDEGPPAYTVPRKGIGWKSEKYMSIPFQERLKLLGEGLQRKAHNGSIIVTTINSGMKRYMLNLRCSLMRLQIQPVLYYTYDIEVPHSPALHCSLRVR